MTARRQPIRGEGAGPRAPRFPRRASLRGSSAGGEALGAVGKLRYRGYREALGALSTAAACMPEAPGITALSWQ